MINIKNKTINADVQVILEELRNYILQRDDKLILKDIKPTGDDIMITCPYHKQGQERKPSCGVNKVDKFNNPAGTVHCFTCGKATFIDSLISNILGIEDGGEQGRKWLLERFDVTNNREIKICFQNRNNINLKNESQFIEENLLKEFRYTHPYMYKRKLNDEIIEKYDIGYDRINDMITFPVRDINGNCLFLAKRSVKGKFFLLPDDKNKPLYGVYELDYSKSEVYICESFFNALTLATYGLNATALMGTGSEFQYELINKLPFRKIIICLDGDKAGRIGTKKLLKEINKNKLVYYINMLEGKDVNDLSKEEFFKLPIYSRSF